VRVDPAEPTDPDVKVWIDPSGEADLLPVFIPSVSDDGVLSWSNADGLDNPPPVSIRGPQGEPGPQGEQGLNGKSAYQYAQDGGYSGTEEEFAEKLAAEYLDTDVPVLRYDPQPLTAEQQAVARENIGAGSAESVQKLYNEIETVDKRTPFVVNDKNELCMEVE
jgi:hypothetical protein